MNGIPITFFLYVTVIFIIGIIASRKTKNLSDFILGGRNLSGPVVALGAGASDMSSWLLLALPGAVFLHGLSEVWLPIGLVIGAYCNWQFVAKRLRIYTEQAHDSLTLSSYFENRFRDSKHVLRLATATVIIVFFTFYASSGFVAAAYLIKLLFHYSYIESLLLGAVIIVAYIVIGGFLAVSWIDFFQGSLMFLALVLVASVSFAHLPDWRASVNQMQLSHYLNLTNRVSTISIISLLAWGLGYVGQPHILVRFMAAKSHRVMPLAKYICTFWMFVALLFAVLTGIVGHAIFSIGSVQPEIVTLHLAENFLPAFIAGIVFAGVLSSAMSATSAQLLAAAGAMTEDYYALFKGSDKKLHPKHLVRIARLSVFLIGVIALSIAAKPNSNIFNLVSYAWAGLGASFGPIIVLSLYWRKMTCRGAMLGMLTGAAVVMAWEFAGHYFGGIFQLYSIMPGFIANCLVSYIVSRMDKNSVPFVAESFHQMLTTLYS